MFSVLLHPRRLSEVLGLCCLLLESEPWYLGFPFERLGTLRGPIASFPSTKTARTTALPNLKMPSAPTPLLQSRPHGITKLPETAAKPEFHTKKTLMRSLLLKSLEASSANVQLAPLRRNPAHRKRPSHSRNGRSAMWEHLYGETGHVGHILTTANEPKTNVLQLQFCMTYKSLPRS